MNYLSVCSGIEAASVAWHPLIWEPVAFSEIDKFPSAVLAHHYPTVPNLGDMTKYKNWIENNGDTKTVCGKSIDLIVGGTPCQSFSVAGLRGGMDDARGNLALTFCRIVEALRPRWVVWENVPGVLSSKRGRDFGSILGALAQCGYGCAYRILDAQYFGVPQRRRRVFVIGHLGDWRVAAAVLFERHSLSGDSPPRREKGERITAPVKSGAPSRRNGGSAPIADEFVTQALGCHRGGPDDNKAQGGFYVPEISRTINSGGQQRIDLDTESFIAHTLRAEHDAGEDGTGRGVPIVFDATQITSRECRSNPKPGDPCHTLASGAHAPTLAQTVTADMYRSGGATAGNNNQGVRNVLLPSVRHLTPRECERLQGFPDDWTLLPYGTRRKLEADEYAYIRTAYPDISIEDAKLLAKDGPRYRAIGNSMAVPVMRWIGERIKSVNKLL